MNATTATKTTAKNLEIGDIFTDSKGRRRKVLDTFGRRSEGRFVVFSYAYMVISDRHNAKPHLYTQKIPPVASIGKSAHVTIENR